MSGVFAISRNIFDHDLFDPEPFTQREAWIWLIKEAAWKARRVRVGNVRIELKRGQCAHSTRFMAKVWKWSEPKVRRFLARLKTDAMILADTDAGVTRLTICNYDIYQRVSLPTDAPTDAPADAEATQIRIQGIQGNIPSEAKASSGRAAPEFSPPAVTDATVYRRGREVLGKSCGGQITKLYEHCKRDWSATLGMIEQAATKAEPAEWVGGVLRKSHDTEMFRRAFARG